jgi:hypothetical protein
MADGHGFNLRGGVGLESTLGTEVVITRKLPLLQPFNFNSGAQVPIPRNAHVGSPSRARSDSGLLSPAPVLNFELDITLADPVFRRFLGQYTDGRATGTLTVDTQVTATDTMTIGTKVYTFQANGSLTNVDGNIELGTTLGETQTNIVNAVNRSGTPGTGYAAAMTINVDAEITAFTTDIATLFAKVGGVAGNSVDTLETFTDITNVFSGATLAGGGTCLYTLLNQMGPNGLTIAADLSQSAVKRVAYPGVKINQMQIVASPGEALMVQCTSFALNRVHDSATNTNAVIAALAQPPVRFLMHHGSGALLVGDQADALDGDDNKKITGFNITMARMLVQYHTQSVTPEEALENDWQGITLSMNHPKIDDSEAFLSWQSAHTPLQAQFTFTRGGNTKIFRFSNLLTEPFAVDVAGPALVNYDTTLYAHNNAAGENAFMNFTGAMELEET